jgi:hypothetical protein
MELTDKGHMVMFIDSQFRRLGMFYESEKPTRNMLIKQLDTRTKWWVMSRCVDYVNERWKVHYGWCDW